MEKILIIKTSSLGDLIHTFPCVHYLRRKFPRAQIDWVVEKPFAEMILAHPQIDRTISVDTRAWRKAPFQGKTWQEIGSFRHVLRQCSYDIAFDLQGNIKSGLLLSQTDAKEKIGFGWKTTPEWPNICFTTHKFNPPGGKNIREDYLFLVQRFFNESFVEVDQKVELRITEEEKEKLDALRLPNDDKILVCPGANWRNKQLAPEVLLDLLKKIERSKTVFFLFIWGTEDERVFSAFLASHFPQNSLVLEKMRLPVLQRLMGKMDLVIAMDSLSLHLCGTTNTSSFGVFGPSSPEKYRPLGEQHLSFQGTCPYKVSFETRCPRLRNCSTGICIKDINSETLFVKLRTKF